MPPAHRDDGSKMRDALKAAGLDKAPAQSSSRGALRCYLEAHIEQGGLLEATGKRIRAWSRRSSASSSFT